MPKLNVKSADRVAAKWATRVSGATQDYTDGAASAGGRWQTGAAAGAANFKTGVQQAAASGMFEKGVAKAGGTRYERGVRDKGAMRYGPGAAAAQGDFQGAIGPVLTTIGSVDVPARGPRGSDANYNRVATIGRALHQARTRA